MKMRRIGSILAVRSNLMLFALCGTVSACGMQVQKKEDMLAAAGFTMVPANTPKRLAELKRLPPHKFLHVMRKNVMEYGYADPTICSCLYVGNQTAYDQYRANVFDKKMADEAQF